MSELLWVFPDLYLWQTGLPSSVEVVVSDPELDLLSRENFGHQASLAVFREETVSGGDDVPAGHQGSSTETCGSAALCFSNTNQPGVLIDLK